MAKGISAGRLDDLASAYSAGAGEEPSATCKQVSRWMSVLVQGEILVLLALTPWLLLSFVGSRKGGSLLISRSSQSSAFVVGLRKFLALIPLSRSCQLVGRLLLIGLFPLHLRWFKMSGKFIGRSWGGVPPDLILALRSAFDRSCVDESWKVWSAGAEAGLLRPYQRADGPVSSGLQAFIGRGSLRIKRRWLGGRAAGGRGSSELYRVSWVDDVDVSSAQFFCQFLPCACAAS